MIKINVNWSRLGLAIIIVTTVIAHLMAVWHYASMPAGFKPTALAAIPFWTLKYLFFLWPAAFIAGPLIASVLSILGWFNVRTILLIGGLIGVVPVIYGQGYEQHSIVFILAYFAAGLLMSGIFWFIYSGYINLDDK